MVTGSYAQQQASGKALPDAPTNQVVLENYSAPKPVLSVIGPYTTRNVPPINLGNSPRLDSLVKDGVIMLSMSDAITIALQDNLDIDIARYNLPIADTDILRTKGGGQPLGVATGIVSGTPGGTGTGVSGGALTSTAASAAAPRRARAARAQAHPAWFCRRSAPDRLRRSSIHPSSAICRFNARFTRR